MQLTWHCGTTGLSESSALLVSVLAVVSEDAGQQLSKTMLQALQVIFQSHSKYDDGSIYNFV